MQHPMLGQTVPYWGKLGRQSGLRHITLGYNPKCTTIANIALNNVNGGLRFGTAHWTHRQPATQRASSFKEGCPLMSAGSCTELELPIAILVQITTTCYHTRRKPQPNCLL